MLFAFDVDGTLLTEEMKDEGEYVRGIIPTSVLQELEKKGHKIAIVSPSPYLPKRYRDPHYWFKRNGSNDYRIENIADACRYHGVDFLGVLYIDDLVGNRKLISKQSHGAIICYSPEKFMKIYEEWT